MSWKNFFYYTKQERRGIAVLLGLIIVVTSVPTLFSLTKTEETVKDYSQKIAELQANAIEIEQPKYKKYNKKETYNNYSRKRSHKTEDQPNHKSSKTKVKKSNPIQENQQVVTSPTENVNIATTNKTTSTIQEKPKVNQKQQPKYTPKPQLTKPININTATAEEFAQLKGIGTILSQRIVKFRNSLGGFVSVQQVGDTFGIKPEVFQAFQSQLVLGNPQIKKHNINNETIEQLETHPYISTKLATQIVNFREKVKPYESFQDVEKLYYFKNQPELYKKIKPYVTF